MAWYYNLILNRFFGIGLVATLRRPTGPSPSMGQKFAFFLGNSQILKNGTYTEYLRNGIFECLPKTGQFCHFCLWEKDKLACSSTDSCFAYSSPSLALPADAFVSFKWS